MKVLVMYVNHFRYTPTVPNIENPPSPGESTSFTNSILAFIQVEEKDEDYDIKSREKKLVNHLKWAARKNNTKNIILHSFAHLSGSKASLNFTKELFDKAQVRLSNAEYNASQTPFGYFLDLNIDAPGFSLARIWTEL